MGRHRGGRFICIVGIDGSGKTTLARSLVDELNKGDIKWRYIYARLVPFLLKPFILIGHKLFLRGENIQSDYAGYAAAKKRIIKRASLLSLAYQWLLMVDYFFQVTVKVRLPLALGRNIVCDRYVYDTLVTDISVDFDYPQEKLERTLNRFFRLFPRPTLTILVDVPEEVAYNRKSDIPSLDYLKERRDAYLGIGRRQGMMILDGTEAPERLVSMAKERVWR